MIFRTRRRLADSFSKSPSYIGPGAALTGNINCEGDLVVAGSINGESSVRGALTLLEGSRWEGKIEVTSAIIAGEVVGDVAAAEKLEIRKSARVHGSVHARIVAVAEGAIIDGQMGITPDSSVIRFQEKRKQNK